MYNNTSRRCRESCKNGSLVMGRPRCACRQIIMVLHRRVWQLVLLLLSIFSLAQQSPFLTNEANKQLGVKYYLTLEPRMDDCTDIKVGQAYTVSGQRFRKINRTTLAVSALINVTQQAVSPVQVHLMVETLQHGTYVYFVEMELQDLCKTVKGEESIWAELVNILNITSCPIPPRVYVLNNYAVYLNGFHLSAQYVGRYRAKVVMSDMLDGEKQYLYCQIFYVRVDRERT